MLISDGLLTFRARVSPFLGMSWSTSHSFPNSGCSLPTFESSYYHDLFDKQAKPLQGITPNAFCSRTFRSIPSTARPSGLSAASPKLPYFVLKCTRWSSAANIFVKGPRVIMSSSLNLGSPFHPQCVRCPGRSPRPSGRGTGPAGIHPPEGLRTDLAINVAWGKFLGKYCYKESNLFECELEREIMGTSFH